MGRIRILSDNVANKIAAGEVVERPASVVKELLENSFDAGATEVRIDTENAGRRLIRIQDNGQGMLRDDAMLAFERHATSKLTDVKDLLAIATLGFRGEALPSIASVSRLLLETRSADEQTGAVVEIVGGKLIRCDEIARATGTTIAVRDLFFNVPARKKFLRSDQTELAHIGSLVTHYSLAHFDKRIELFHEGRELLNVTPVPGIRERAYQVFGSDLMNDLIDIGVRTKEVHLPAPYVAPHTRPSHIQGSVTVAPDPATAHYTIRGLVSAPHIQKLNRNSIFLFVNGRLIRDRLILHSLTAAYHNLMPPGCYPFAMLFLECDPGEVDVNVHPAKTEVRFRQGSQVHDFIRDTLREVLMESRPVSDLPLMPKSPVFGGPHQTQPDWGAPRRFEFPDRPIQQGAVLPFSEFTEALVSGQPQSGSWPAAPSGFQEMSGEDLPEITLPRPFPSSISASVEAAGHDIALDLAGQARTARIPDTHGALDHLPAEWQSTESYQQLPELRPLGQLHESFIVAAGRDGLWIIDQHVAHERILFEQVLRQRSSGRVEVQHLLMPLVLKLTPGQEFEYARIADELQAYGFETEPFGQRTIAVKAAPAGIGAADIEKVIFEVLEIAESELRSASIDDLRRSVSATIACRAAIKINTRLESTKMEWLLRSLAACQYPMSCPHGRPVALRYSTKDILKSFHRI